MASELEDILRTAGHGVKNMIEYMCNSLDEETAIEVARILGKYNDEAAALIAWRLSYVAINTNDKEAMIEAARTVGKYEEKVAGEIAMELIGVAEDTKNKENVKRFADIMSLDEIVSTVKRYEEEAAVEIVRRLSYVAEYTNDKEATIEAARIVGKYNEEVAVEIAKELSNVAMDTKDRGSVMSACKLVNKAGSDVFGILNYKDLVEVHKKGLDDLVDDKDSFDAVAAYLKSRGELPLPSKDNIADYGAVVSNYLSKEYGIRKKLNNNQILMLFSVKREDRAGLAELVNNSQETRRKDYSIAVGDEGAAINVDIDNLPRHSLIAIIGSMDPAKEKEAFDSISKIVGEKSVRNARNAFTSNYKYLRRRLAELISENKTDEALKILSETKNEAINDVLVCAEHRNIGLGGKVLEAVESNNPLDYDNRVQMACVYLPRDYRNGIYEYCKDNRFTLVRYDIGGRSLGSAICYGEGDTFLVDSVEGHRVFRKPQIFKAVYEDLLTRAKEKGYRRIIFSNGGINETARGFLNYLDSIGLPKGSVKMRLDTNGYLEADEDRVEGYVIDLVK
ncbi:MAG: hypothetical protein QW292_00980 [Candidatus Parvarchaeota archaeon]